MFEFVVLAAGAVLGLALIAGGAFVLLKLARERRAADAAKLDKPTPPFAAAKDFEIDYRRVLTFAKLTVRR
jgi:hypothetical protein